MKPVHSRSECPRKSQQYFCRCKQMRTHSGDWLYLKHHRCPEVTRDSDSIEISVSHVSFQVMFSVWNSYSLLDNSRHKITSGAGKRAIFSHCTQSDFFHLLPRLLVKAGILRNGVCQGKSCGCSSFSTLIEVWIEVTPVLTCVTVVYVYRLYCLVVFILLGGCLHICLRSGVSGYQELLREKQKKSGYS